VAGSRESDMNLRVLAPRSWFLSRSTLLSYSFIWFLIHNELPKNATITNTFVMTYEENATQKKKCSKESIAFADVTL
jgi:hypothetical protein